MLLIRLKLKHTKEEALAVLVNIKNSRRKLLLIAENMKKYARNVLYDKLHRGGVLVCIGLTLYGSVLLGDHFYKYYRYVKPQIEAAKEAAEKELLAEGSSERLV